LKYRFSGRLAVGPRIRRGPERHPDYQSVPDDPSTDEMFLDDALQYRRVASGVPGAFGIDDSNRSTFTDAKAVRFGAKNPALLRKAELLQTTLQVFPGSEPTLLLTAFGRGLVAAEKDVPPRNRHTDRYGDVPL
jgi:hypothetical protein